MSSSKWRRPGVAFRFGWALATFVAVLAVLPSAVSADLVLRVGDAQLVEGQTGFFDVFLEVTGGPYDLAAYMVELNLTGPTSGVRFTGFAEPSNAVFPGRTPQHTGGRPALPGTVGAASDDLPTGSLPIVNGAGLIRVLFEADLGSAREEPYAVTVDLLRSRTNFTNGSEQLLNDLTNIGSASGTIRLDPVPEPSTVALLLTGLVVGLVVAIRRFSQSRR